MFYYDARGGRMDAMQKVKGTNTEWMQDDWQAEYLKQGRPCRSLLLSKATIGQNADVRRGNALEVKFGLVFTRVSSVIVLLIINEHLDHVRTLQLVAQLPVIIPGTYTRDDS